MGQDRDGEGVNQPVKPNEGEGGETATPKE